MNVVGSYGDERRTLGAAMHSPWEASGAAVFYLYTNTRSLSNGHDLSLEWFLGVLKTPERFVLIY